MLRDGGLENYELKGDLDIRVNDADCSKVKLELAPADFSDVQFKQHPKFVKFGNGPKVIALKNDSQGFPVNQNLGVLKWRMNTKDESHVPLTVTVWPQPNGGQSDVAVEYELEAQHLTLKNVVISIPIPPGALPVVSDEDAQWTADRGFFQWTIDTVDADSPSGSLEFRCDGDADTFFPTNVGFAASGSLAGVDVQSARLADGSEAPLSQEKIITVDKYEIV